MLKAFDALSAGNTLLKKFHTLEQELATLHQQVTELKTDVAGMRGEQLRLEGRVSRLEENRETLLAKMEVIAVRAEQETKIALANAVAQLQMDNSRYQSELYRTYLEAQHRAALLSNGAEKAGSVLRSGSPISQIIEE